MKTIHEYLEKATDFEKLAADEKDSKFKASLLKQSRAYRKLAIERAKRLHLALPPVRPQSK
jgi:hypothetical protein